MGAPLDIGHFSRSERRARPVEQLVVDGLRHWTVEPAPDGQTLHALFERDLSESQARAAAAALEDFAAALGLCAACPLRIATAGSDDLSRDETLILGLVSAIQNGDGAAADMCLRALTCASRCDAVALAAGAFALIMRSFGKTLRPMPARFIRDALREAAGRERPLPESLH
ncbi:MAG: hypothetical protein NXH91_14135 [Phyllobacteriaceae bacterium]|nr:hypothetical protein [Phyllobacteriaceae bacterium]